MGLTRLAIADELQRRALDKRVTRCAVCGHVIDSVDQFGALGVSAGRIHVDGGVTNFPICDCCLRNRALTDFLYSPAMRMVDRRVLSFDGFAFQLSGFAAPPAKLYPYGTPGDTVRDAWDKAVACRAQAGLDHAVCAIEQLPMSLPQDAQILLAVVVAETPRDGRVMAAFAVSRDAIRSGVYADSGSASEEWVEQTVRPRFWANVHEFSSFPPRVPCAASTS